jgi:transcriptional regulator with XRE-family HTH domain
MLVNRSELAKALNLSKGRISQLEKAKVLRPTRGGKFHLEKAQDEYLAHVAARGAAHPGKDDGAQVKAIAEVMLRRQQAKLEYEKILTELLGLRVQLQRGELISRRAAKQLAGMQFFDAGRRISNHVPLSFIPVFAESREEAVKMDELLSKLFEDCFRLTNLRDIGREIERVLRWARRVKEAADTDNPELSDIARKFAAEIIESFSAMRPEWVNQLGLRFLVRGEPHPFDETEEEPEPEAQGPMEVGK